MEYQEAAESAVKEGLREIDKRLGYRGPFGNVKPLGQYIDWRKVDEIELKNFPEGREKNGNRTLGVVTEVTPEKVLVFAKDTRGYIYVQDMEWAHKYDPSVDAISFGKMKNAKEVLKVGDAVDVKILEEKDKKGNLKFALEQEPVVQSALLCIEPATGFIRAMVGGYDFDKSKFNRAIQAQRQPGSSFKPIVYSASFEKGFTPASIFIDSPVIFEEKDEENWKPANFEEKFYGPTNLRTALTHSRNVITIKLLQSMGVKHILEYARRLGIKSYLKIGR